MVINALLLCAAAISFALAGYACQRFARMRDGRGKTLLASLFGVLAFQQAAIIIDVFVRGNVAGALLCKMMCLALEFVMAGLLIYIVCNMLRRAKGGGELDPALGVGDYFTRGGDTE